MMKNLMIYINPRKDFDDEHKILAKIQIDNSLDLGWKKEDILFFTNFPYEYNGIKALLVPDNNFYSPRPLSTKIITVEYLFEEGLIEKEKIYWVHDLDAYELNKISESELGLDGYDLGLTTYGWKKRWCLGSLFFKDSSKDIFSLIKNTVSESLNDEDAMVVMTRNNSNNINERCKILNITYNIGMRHIGLNYNAADKPLKVLHFHPQGRRGIDTLGPFMYGKNEINSPLMSERLIKIFNRHAIK